MKKSNSINTTLSVHLYLLKHDLRSCVPSVSIEYSKCQTNYHCIIIIVSYCNGMYVLTLPAWPSYIYLYIISRYITSQNVSFSLPQMDVIVSKAKELSPCQQVP